MTAFDDKSKDDYVTIETHFGVPGHFIRAATRNKCSEDLVSMLKETSQILYPGETFEIYLLAPEPGSYKDIVKFVKKYKVGASVAVVVSVSGVAIAYLNYKDSHETHEHDKKTWVVDDTAKCLELQKNLDELSAEHKIENIPEGKIREICGNLNLKKRKNDFFNTLKEDGMVENNETTLRDSKNNIVLSKRVDRSDFSNYIEPIIDTRYSRENIEGVIELISPVVRQKKEGRGITWRGTYYGDDISIEGILILKNGEDIEFYMQDSDFKDQISNKERVFAVKDNMRAVFDVTGELKNGVFQNRSIYIKEVKNYNEEVIPHKEKFMKYKNISRSSDDDQGRLFD